MNSFLWVNIKTEITKRFFQSRKLHNNGEIYLLRGKPQQKYQRMVEINRKALQILQFLWPVIFFVFFLVTKEVQVEAAEGNQDLTDNS